VYHILIPVSHTTYPPTEAKMPQALDASAYVFQGVWTNWSKKGVLGVTLTLSPANAAVLVAILALFVQMTGSQLWTVIQFTFHQHRASEVPKDALYHQQQAVLRNNPSDLNTLRQLFRLMWAWRGKSKKPVRRSLRLMLWAICHFVFFGLAGVFSSTLIAAGDGVLSRSPYCGVFKQSYLDALNSQPTTGFVSHLNLDFQAKSQDDTELSQEYVQTCYNNTDSSSSCASLPKRQLSFTTNATVACPFDAPVCHPQTPAVSYDTGYIDSSNDLGLNAKETDRISYRRVTTCTPLNDQAYITSWRNVSSTNGGPNIQAVDAYYGPSRGADRNATFSYGSFSQYRATDQMDDADPYEIHQENAFSGAGYENAGSFLPIPQLARPNADILLAFLSFDKAYDAPVNDPWFSAHQPSMIYESGDSSINSTIYSRDLPVTTIGCTEQHQVCTGIVSNASQARCTPLMGSYQIQTESGGVLALNFTDRQNSTYVRVFQAVLDSTMENYLSRLIQRDMPLLARKKVILVVSSALPDNQWQVETAYWHSIAMAQLQRDVVYFGTGQMSPDTSFIAVANTTADKWLCQNLIVRGTSYQSYSVFVLALLFVVGVLIVVLSLVVEDIAAFIQRRWSRGATGRDMWKANETLQIQRMLYEHGGFGTWHDGPNGVPVTEFGDEMGMLKVGDISMSNTRAATRLSLETKLASQNAHAPQSPASVGVFSGRLSGVRRSGVGYSPIDSQEGTP
jgi:hypothetical protein